MREKRDEAIAEKNRLKKQLKRKNELIKKLQNQSISKVRKKAIAKELIKPYMSEARADAFLRDKPWKRIRNWSKEDIILGITLRALSRKAYTLLRKQKILPLPSETVLSDSFAHFQLDEGTVLQSIRFYSLLEFLYTTIVEHKECRFLRKT